MEKITCEICGGNTLVKQEKYFRCADCGACYSPEQLKSPQNTPLSTQIHVNTSKQQEFANKKHKENTSNQNSGRKFNYDSIKKKSKKILPVFCAALFLLIVFQILHTILIDNGIFPDVNHSKSLAKEFIQNQLSKDGYQLTNIKFHQAEVESFKTKAEDTFDYFSSLEDPFILDGTEYENHYEYFKDCLGEDYDPESNVKWAYMLSGTCKASTKHLQNFEFDFYIVYVYNPTFGWDIPIYEISPSMDLLTETVEYNISAYLSVAYEIKPTPDIIITSIEKSSSSNEYYINYKVYGKIEVKDLYGDVYTGKFTAEYQRTKNGFVFEEIYKEIGELTHSKFTDIFK